jgi:hypothetical protein
MPCSQGHRKHTDSHCGADALRRDLDIVAAGISILGYITSTYFLLLHTMGYVLLSLIWPFDLTFINYQEQVISINET